MCVVCGDDLIEKKRFEKQRLASLSESLFNALENVMKEIDERRLVKLYVEDVREQWQAMKRPGKH